VCGWKVRLAVIAIGEGLIDLIRMRPALRQLTYKFQQHEQHFDLIKDKEQ
jgi:hypothetical protein